VRTSPQLACPRHIDQWRVVVAAENTEMTVELASEERFRKIEGNGEEPEKFTCQMLIGSVNCDQCTW
jgi:hypothetical protein